MKRLSLLFPAIALLLIGGGCSTKPVQTVEITNTSAKDIYESTIAQVAREHSQEATLIGYNNQGLTFDRINDMPLEKDTSGIMPYWAFVFVKDEAALSDNMITDEETFAVEFSSGDIFVSEGVVVRNYSLDNDSWLGSETLLAVDSDTLINQLVNTIEQQTETTIDIEHVNINATPGVYEVTIFSPNNVGFEAHIDPRNGDIIYWNSVEFISY